MKIVLLSTRGIRGKMVYHYLNTNFSLVGVIIDETLESAEKKRKKHRRRIKRLGYLQTYSMALFTRLIVPLLLKKSGESRLRAIYADTEMDDLSNYPNAFRAKDINDSSVVEYIKGSMADLVVIHATGILKRHVLEEIGVPIINFHPGFTQRYRGLSSGYWALYYDDKEHFGATVHLVEPGIDTGYILSQKKVKASWDDNWLTYPVLITSKCLDCFDQAISILKENNESKDASELLKGVGEFYYHPTAFQYLWGRLSKGVK